MDVSFIPPLFIRQQWRSWSSNPALEGVGRDGVLHYESWTMSPPMIFQPAPSSLQLLGVVLVCAAICPLSLPVCILFFSPRHQLPLPLVDGSTEPQSSPLGYEGSCPSRFWISKGHPPDLSISTKLRVKQTGKTFCHGKILKCSCFYPENAPPPI